MMKSKEEIIELFNSEIAKGRVAHYKKFGRFLFRNAIEGETILTIVSGKLETYNTADNNSIVVRNLELGSSAEMYVMPIKTFKKRYDEYTDKSMLVDGIIWGVADAKGECESFEYIGDEITFLASWGEKMIAVSGDYIARPIDGDPYDIYRIELDSFIKTYKKK